MLYKKKEIRDTGGKNVNVSMLGQYTSRQYWSRCKMYQDIKNAEQGASNINIICPILVCEWDKVF